MRYRWALPLVLLLAAMAPRPAESGVPGPGYLVADLVEGTAASSFQPRFLDTLDGRLYFAGRTTTTGVEPWRTDGTPEGTEQVADLCGGSCSSAGYVSEIFNGELYYPACGQLGCALWKTDGTTLVPIFEGEGRVTAMAVWNGALYFGTRTGELRRTDGSGPGTLLHHFGDLTPIVLLPAENAVFVLAQNFGLAFLPPPELWRTDGTPAGTFRISEPSWFVKLFPVLFNGKAVLRVWADLWVVDSSGAEPLFDVSPFTGPEVHEAVSGVLFVHDEGVRLWRTDGTTPGTALVAETPSPVQLLSAVYQGEVYFVLGWQSGVLYRTTDLAGETMVYEFPGPISNLRVLDGRLYAEVGRPARELWAVSREPPAADAVSQLFTLPASDSFAQTASLNGALFFDLTTPAGSELGRYTEAGGVETLTQTGGGLSGDPQGITRHRDGVLFKVDSVAWGASDGTPQGTFEFPGDAFRTRMVGVGDEAFIQATREMLTVDPGGQLVQVFAFDADLVSGVIAPTAHGIVFPTLSPDLGVDLWIGDRGTGEEHLLRDQIHVASIPVLGSALDERLDDEKVLLFFEGTVARTNGTVGGTAKIFDAALSTCDCLIYDAVRAGGYVYFAGSEAARLGEPRPTWRLWRTNGTPAGTSVVRAFPPDGQNRGFYLSTLTAVGARVFFVTFDPATGEELWTSDGTPGGTVMVRDLKPGEGSSSPRGLAAHDGRLYFAADDGARGRELWVSDGTAPGTLLVTDILPGPRSSNVQHLTVIDATLVFAADDGVHGLELWTSDGTAAGTSLRQDIQTGPLGSDPHEFTASGDLVFFNAGRDDVGYELWALPRDALFEPPIFVDGFEAGDTLAWSSTVP